MGPIRVTRKQWAEALHNPDPDFLIPTDCSIPNRAVLSSFLESPQTFLEQHFNTSNATADSSDFELNLLPQIDSSTLPDNTVNPEWHGVIDPFLYAQSTLLSGQFAQNTQRTIDITLQELKDTTFRQPIEQPAWNQNDLGFYACARQYLTAYLQFLDEDPSSIRPDLPEHPEDVDALFPAGNCFVRRGLSPIDDIAGSPSNSLYDQPFSRTAPAATPEVPAHTVPAQAATLGVLAQEVPVEAATPSEPSQEVLAQAANPSRPSREVRVQPSRARKPTNTHRSVSSPAHRVTKRERVVKKTSKNSKNSKNKSEWEYVDDFGDGPTGSKPIRTVRVKKDDDEYKFGGPGGSCGCCQNAICLNCGKTKRGQERPHSPATLRLLSPMLTDDIFALRIKQDLETSVQEKLDLLEEHRRHRARDRVGEIQFLMQVPDFCYQVPNLMAAISAYQGGSEIPPPGMCRIYGAGQFMLGCEYASLELNFQNIWRTGFAGCLWVETGHPIVCGGYVMRADSFYISEMGPEDYEDSEAEDSEADDSEEDDSETEQQ